MGLMNKRRGLQRVTRCLVDHPGGSQFSKLIVNQRKQFPGGIWVARLDPIQDKSHSAHEWITTEG